MISKSKVIAMSEIEKRTISLPSERWLRDEVAPTYDRMRSDPKRGVSAEKVFADIRARHVSSLKSKA
jgi:hypothetical protein